MLLITCAQRPGPYAFSFPAILRLRWTPNASGYAPKVYRVSDFELGEDYYFSEQTFPPIAQESRRIRTSRPIRKLRSSSFLCYFVIPGRNILITWPD